MTTAEMIVPVFDNMTQNVSTVLFYIFVAVLICCVIVVIAISLANKSLLCAKIYTFIFKHDDWLLYKKAKKQGIQHYLNGRHLSQFYKEWNKVKDEYGIVDDDFATIDEKVADELLSKRDELAKKYNYKEYDDVYKRIKDGDIVLSWNMYGSQLYISVGDSVKNVFSWAPMVKDIVKSQVHTRLHGYNDVYKLLLTNPKEVISF